MNAHTQDQVAIRKENILKLCSLNRFTIQKFNSNHIRINSLFDVFFSTCKVVFIKTCECKVLRQHDSLYLDDLIAFIEEKENLLLIQRARNILKKRPTTAGPV